MVSFCLLCHIARYLSPRFVLKDARFIFIVPECGPGIRLFIPVRSCLLTSKFLVPDL